MIKTTDIKWAPASNPKYKYRRVLGDYGMRFVTLPLPNENGKAEEQSRM